MRPQNLGGASCATQHKDRPQNQKEFAADTAGASGESKAQVNRHLARAEALGDDLDEVAGFLEYEREQARKRLSASGGDRKSGVEDFPQPIEGTGKARDKAGSRMGGGA